MTLALRYDVHGNPPALEAGLADAEAAGADGVRRVHGSPGSDVIGMMP